MASNLQFEADDTSPTISYFPRRDTLSTVNLTTGWNPYFEDTGFSTALGEIGSGTSMHITSLDGASLSIQWHGTGIEVYGNATDATYSVSIDRAPVNQDVEHFRKSDNMLAFVNDLTNTQHTLTLTAHTSSEHPSQSFIAFNKAILTIAPPQATNSADLELSLKTLSDSSINFNGQWTFNNGQWESKHAGDAAHATFLGTGFMLTGATSPDAGTFSVDLDNSRVQLSAKSSFYKSDSLLYYATGLDPSVSHNVSLSNDDGSTLALPVGSMRAFAASNPNPTSSSESNGSAPFPAGTIAAIVLAAILVIVLAAWLFFYLSFYRPRMHRRRIIPRSMPSPIREENGVLDIRPMSNISPEERNDQKRTSSDYHRWSHDVRGSGSLGVDLLFRHSGASTEKDARDFSNLSMPQATGNPPIDKKKGKGKGRWFGQHDKSGSSSPSFKLDLPLPAEGEDDGGLNRMPSRSRGSWSPKFPLSYLAGLSTPSLGRQKDVLAPSRPKIPKFHTRNSSQRPLLQLQITPPSDHPYGDASQQRSSYQSTTPRTLTGGRENARSSGAGALNISGLSAAQAIRGLSPRTSERRSDTNSIHLFDNRSSRRSVALHSEDPIPKLPMLEHSPFKVDLDTGDAFKKGRRIPSGVASAVGHTDHTKRISVASHVRFEESETSTTGDKALSSEAEASEEITEERRMPQRSGFHSTSPTTPRARIVSFLDFSSSSGDSSQSGSDARSHRSSEVWAPSSDNPDTTLRSKWSSTTGPMQSDVSHNSGARSSVPPSPSYSAIFPFPTTLPASPHHPEGHRLSPPPPLQTTIADDSGSTQLHEHPFMQTSPTESVPLSILASELRFNGNGRRNGSDSDEAQRPAPQSHLPPHPPLPHHGEVR